MPQQPILKKHGAAALWQLDFPIFIFVRFFLPFWRKGVSVSYASKEIIGQQCRFRGCIIGILFSASIPKAKTEIMHSGKAKSVRINS
jgi:hypothetical protein